MIGVALFLIWRPGKKTAGGTVKKEYGKCEEFRLEHYYSFGGYRPEYVFRIHLKLFRDRRRIFICAGISLFLKFPVHTATATSIFILMITALTGSMTHVAAGLFHPGIRHAVGLSIGAILGAQVAARLSHHIGGDLDHSQPRRCVGLVGLKLVAAAY
jgi:hypothetical protein